MAMIGNIRRQSNLLIIVIALGMLLFLIPWDSFFALIGAGQYQDRGTINGKAITTGEYDMVRKIRSDCFEYGSGSQLDNAIWEDMAQKYILNDEFENLGLAVGDDEFDAMMFGDYIPTSVKNVYYQQGIDDEKRDLWRRNWEFWQSQDSPERVSIDYHGRKKITIDTRLKEKWEKMVQSGVYHNKIDAKYSYKMQNDKVDIDYVFVKYDAIPDSLISYDEADIKAYYNRHKDDVEFLQDRERDIEYIEFQVQATDADSSAMKEELTELAAKWREADNDTTFYIKNTAAQAFQSKYYLGGEYGAVQDAAIQNAEPGAVIGPFKSGSPQYRLTKVLARVNQPDSAEVRHILFGLQQNPGMTIDDLMERSDSVKAAIESGSATFEDMVTEWSNDPGSIAKGGVYDMFGRNHSFVPPFLNASFENPVGTLISVETGFGVHLIEVLKQTAPVSMVQYTEIVKNVEASSDTKKGIFEQARQFSIDNGSSEAFTSAADTLGLPVKEAKAIKPGVATVTGIGQAGNLVSWVFQAKEGDVSGVIQTGSGSKYVVAHLNRVKDKGTPPFRYVMEEMEEGLKKELKAELYRQKLDGADMTSIAEAAGVPVKKSNQVLMSLNTITGSGAGQKEYEAVGLAFGLTTSDISLPIAGESGVFVIAPYKDVNYAEVPEEIFEEQDKLTTASRSRARNNSPNPKSYTGIYGSMKRKADMEDNRFQY